MNIQRPRATLFSAKLNYTFLSWPRPDQKEREPKGLASSTLNKKLQLSKKNTYLPRNYREFEITYKDASKYAIKYVQFESRTNCILLGTFLSVL